MIDKELLDKLVCPKSKEKVEFREAAAGEDVDGWLECKASGLRYPIREGIPIMLIDEAQPIPERG